MSSRSADASIKGYMYQFIHTLKDILISEDDTVNIVEGIEDLDIRNNSEEILVQYKYHELQHFTNSLVAKPIGLMFNHFIDISGDYKYRLAIFLDDDLPDIDSKRLEDILALKSAQDYITSDNIKYCSNKNQIESFLEFFKWTKTSKYKDVESSIIELIVDTFHVSIEEAEIVYLPNAINKIIDLAIHKDIEKRKIKTFDFKNYLTNKKTTSDIAYICRLNGEAEAIKQISKRMKNDGCKKNSADIVVSFDDANRFQLEDIVIDIAKTYFYKGNKNDFRPITFIVNETLELKKKIVKKIIDSNEVIIFNDGYEDYFFCKEVFNSKAITTGLPQRSKVNDVNFNFKLISKKTFLSNRDNINLNNGILVTVGCIDERISKGFLKTYHLGCLGNSSIVDILGGCNG